MATVTKDVVKRQEAYLTAVNGAELRQLIQENMGGQITVNDLTRIKMPAGGGLAWTVPTLNGEEAVTELKGVIIHQQTVRAYWPTAFDGGSGGQPPQCQGDEYLQGKGDPGGDCLLCPFSQFGSKGRGQACKQTHRVYLLRPNTMMPLVVSLPPTSIKIMRDYGSRVTNQKLFLAGVITSISLEKTKNSQGIAYSQARFAVDCELTKEETQAIMDYAKSFKLLVSSAVTAEDYGETEG